MHGVLDAFVERVEHFVFGAGAGGHREVDVEHAADDRGGVEDRGACLGDRRSRRRSMRPVSADGRSPSRSARMHPAPVLVANDAVVEQHAHELRREQRIAFGVALDVRRRARGSPRRRRRRRSHCANSALGEARQRDLVEALVAQQAVAALERLAARVLRAHREADENALVRRAAP